MSQKSYMEEATIEGAVLLLHNNISLFDASQERSFKNINNIEMFTGVITDVYVDCFRETNINYDIRITGEHKRLTQEQILAVCKEFTRYTIEVYQL